MQVCTSLQIDNHANIAPVGLIRRWMPFLPLSQQRQSTGLLLPMYLN